MSEQALVELKDAFSVITNENQNFGETHSIQTKTCSTCNKTLPVTQFKLRKRKTLDGYREYYEGSCRKCSNQKRKDYKASLPEEVRLARQTARRDRELERLSNLSPEQLEARKNQKKQYKDNLPEWKREEQKLLQSIKVNENKRRWLKHKEQEGCFACKGENLGKSVALFGEAYDSHHVHTDKKTNSKGLTIEISKMISGGYSWESIKEELGRTTTLCKYCHSQWHSKNLFIDFQKWSGYDPSKPLKI